MHKKTSKKGFTLVEIMIVVVIIGLLAAMAIPAFKKVRQDSRASSVANDARQLASAAQQYMLENNVTTIAHAYNSTTGTVAAALTPYVRRIGAGYTIDPASITIDGTFKITHSGLEDGSLTFTAEGQEDNTPAPAT